MATIEINHNRVLYFFRYFNSVLKNLLNRNHVLCAEAEQVDLHEVIHEQKVEKWAKVLSTRGNQDAHHTYYGDLLTMAFFNLVTQLNLRLSDMLHLRSKIWFHQYRPQDPKHSVNMSAGLEKIFCPNNKHAIVKFFETVEDNETLYASHHDYFAIRNPESYQIEKQSSSKVDALRLSRLHTRVAQLDLTSITPHHYYINKNEAIKYGVLSGDLNLVHTTKLSCKLFGFKRPFVQGLLTLNLVLEALAEELEQKQLSEHISFVDIVFSNRVYVDQTIAIYCSDNLFEVIDENQQVCAFGRWRHQK